MRLPELDAMELNDKELEETEKYCIQWCVDRNDLGYLLIAIKLEQILRKLP